MGADTKYVCQNHKCADHKDEKDPECLHEGCVLTPFEEWMDQYAKGLTIVER